MLIFGKVKSRCKEINSPGPRPGRNGVCRLDPRAKLFLSAAGFITLHLLNADRIAGVGI